jgi:hypothetical protein
MLSLIRRLLSGPCQQASVSPAPLELEMSSSVAAKTTPTPLETIPAESAPMAAPEPPRHGHKPYACFWCPHPEECTCPCAVCLRCRQARAGIVCVACHSDEDVIDRLCAYCRASEEDEWDEEDEWAEEEPDWSEEEACDK